MLFRSRKLWAVVVGLWMMHPLPAQEPPRLGLDGNPSVTPNQKVVNTIADSLRQSGHLRNYTIDVTFYDGTAELTGTVADQPQREEALRIVQGVPGVERVLDRLTLAGSITQVQAGVQPPPLAEPPLADRPDAANDGPSAEPVPVFQGAPPSPYDLAHPRMPPYAWPTYAPYNNFSRVAYPEAYPYNAWPFIGPVYPFPKIPLSWRSVKLQWRDGHWWFSRLPTKQDWWRLRYW